MHLKPLRNNRQHAEVDPLIAIAGGELDVDLRNDIAAEGRAKIVYERLIQFTTDSDTINALQFLMSREITHTKAFTRALESLGKDPFSIGALLPTPGLVNQYFDDSTGIGDRGEPNARGPWNLGSDWELVEAPAFRTLRSEIAGTWEPKNGRSDSETSSSSQGRQSERSRSERRTWLLDPGSAWKGATNRRQRPFS